MKEANYPLSKRTTPPCPPALSLPVALTSLPELLGPRNVLGALAVMRNRMGNIFQLSLPRFAPYVVCGPESLHEVLTSKRDALRWRQEHDPVTALLRHGLLVEDGDSHDSLRRVLRPSVHRERTDASVAVMRRRTEQVIAGWPDSGRLDLLVESRKIAMLIFMDAFFGVDFSTDYNRLLPDVYQMLTFISPGSWLFLGGKRRASGIGARLEEYLTALIRERKTNIGTGDDMLSGLLAAGLDEPLVRDQMLTMLIAGHDTSTALLSWILYELGRNPDIQQRVREEIALFPGEEAFARRDELVYLKQVIQETLRMYPPIFGGNRITAEDLELGGYLMPKGSRVMLSYYATHHDPALWPEPGRFDPDRFASGRKIAPYTYLPFGGGPRNCLGSYFAQVEALVSIIVILRAMHLRFAGHRVHLHMGATLEPRPGVWMEVSRRPSEHRML